MRCGEWRYETTFASDILEKLNNLNTTLHRKGLFANEMLRHVGFFQMKVWLFARHGQVRETFDTFPFLESKGYWKCFLKDQEVPHNPENID